MIDEERSEFTLVDRLRAAVSPPILVLLPIYCLGLIPGACLMAWIGTRVDRWLGIPSLGEWLPLAARLEIFVLCILLGGGILVWSYTYLVLEGGGGPVPPFSANTRRLVTSGPYAYVRHPSIWGKIIGVVGLGVLFGSPTFLAIIIPLLLTWSLGSNMRNQDAEMEAAFGDEFRAWRNRTPRLVPRLGRG